MFRVPAGTPTMLKQSPDLIRRHMLAFLAVPLLLGQNAESPAGKKVFAERCVVCHGPDAAGANRGPSLAGNRRLRTRSAQQLRRLIQTGVPAAGMPAFDLPASDLDALVAFVRSLNSPAADSSVPGSPPAGEQFFFGAGHCASCHMVGGRGAAIGPDLSNVGRQMTLEEI